MALFVLSLCPFDISVGIGAFVIGLGQISSFLSLLEVFPNLNKLEWRSIYLCGDWTVRCDACAMNENNGIPDFKRHAAIYVRDLVKNNLK